MINRMIIILSILLQTYVRSQEVAFSCADEICYNRNNPCIDMQLSICNYLDRCSYFIKSGEVCGDEMTCRPLDTENKCVSIYESTYGCDFDQTDDDQTDDPSNHSIKVTFNNCDEFISNGIKYPGCTKNTTRLYLNRVVRIAISPNEEPILVKYTTNGLCYSYFYQNDAQPICTNYCKELKKTYCRILSVVQLQSFGLSDR